MFSTISLSTAAALLLAVSPAAARWPAKPEPRALHNEKMHSLMKRQFPANATDVKTFVTPTNVTIRYKNPGADGVCETTPGVNSYAGYIDLSPNMHTFFW